jgi:DNA-binding transcriptional regulator YdaS (Cro superfamily)
MDTLSGLVYEATKTLGGTDRLATRIGVASWEVFQWIAGVNLPQGRKRAILLQSLSLIARREAHAGADRG